MAFACSACVSGWSKLYQTIIALLSSPLEFLIYRKRVCVEVESKTFHTCQVTFSTSRADHVPKMITISTEPTRANYRRQLKTKPVSLWNRLSYTSSELFPSIDRIILSQVLSILSVVHRFYASQEGHP